MLRCRFTCLVFTQVTAHSFRYDFSLRLSLIQSFIPGLELAFFDTSRHWLLVLSDWLYGRDCSTLSVYWIFKLLGFLFSIFSSIFCSIVCGKLSWLLVGFKRALKFSHCKYHKVYCINCLHDVVDTTAHIPRGRSFSSHVSDIIPRETFLLLSKIGLC